MSPANGIQGSIVCHMYIHVYNYVLCYFVYVCGIFENLSITIDLGVCCNDSTCLAVCMSHRPCLCVFVYIAVTCTNKWSVVRYVSLIMEVFSMGYVHGLSLLYHKISVLVN